MVVLKYALFVAFHIKLGCSLLVRVPCPAVIGHPAALSIPIIVPCHFVIGQLFLDQRLSKLMVTPTEPLRVPVDQQLLVPLINPNSTATWAIGLPLLRDLIVCAQFLPLEFVEYISVVRAFKVSTDQRDLLAIRVVTSWCESDLNVLEHSICV